MPQRYDLAAFGIASKEDLTKAAALLLALSGRRSACAEKWVAEGGRGGYSPVCALKRRNTCRRGEACRDCNERRLMPLDEEMIKGHLLGRCVLGTYVMNEDGRNCNLLVADFDSHHAPGDPFAQAAAVVAAAAAHGIPAYVERSQSGRGYHVWIWFSAPVEAAVARRMGGVLLRDAGVADDPGFDRMFPAQSALRGHGGMGNLVALPLQPTAAMARGGSLFLDIDSAAPHPDQLAFLAGVERADPDVVAAAAAEWPEEERRSGSARGGRVGDPGDMAAMLDQCDFLAHCRENAATLSYNLWMGLSRNLAPWGDEGRARFHELSRPYPRYTPEETDRMFDGALERLALDDGGPITCEWLAGNGFRCPKLGDCRARAPAAMAWAAPDPEAAALEAEVREIVGAPSGAEEARAAWERVQARLEREDNEFLRSVGRHAALALLPAMAGSGAPASAPMPPAVRGRGGLAVVRPGEDAPARRLQSADWPTLPEDLRELAFPAGTHGIRWGVSEGVSGDPVQGPMLSTAPITIGGRLVEAETGREFYRLVFFRRGEWCSHVAARKDCLTPRLVSGLADYGVPLVPGAERQLATYLAKLEAENTEWMDAHTQIISRRCGWHVHGDVPAFVHGRRTIGGGAVFEPLGEGAGRILDITSPRGAWEGERTAMLAALGKWPGVAWMLGAAAGASLARPLFDAGVLDVQGYVAETVSDQTGKGKTTSVIIAVAPWMAPKALRPMWGTTFAILTYMEILSDLPMPFQEAQMSQQGGQGRDAINMEMVITALCDGGGKLQGAREGGTRRQIQLYGALLAANNDTCLPPEARQGPRVRVLTVPPLIPPTREGEVEAVARELAANHGHGGPRMIERMLAEAGGSWEALQDALAARALAEAEALQSRIPADAPRDVLGILRRQAKLAGVGLLGLDLLLRHGYDADGAILAAAREGFLSVWDGVVDEAAAVQRPDWEVYLDRVRGLVQMNSHRLAGLEGKDREGRPMAPAGGYVGVFRPEEGFVGVRASWLSKELAREYHRAIRGLSIAWLREGVLLPNPQEGRNIAPMVRYRNATTGAQEVDRMYRFRMEASGIEAGVAPPTAEEELETLRSLVSSDGSN